MKFVFFTLFSFVTSLAFAQDGGEIAEFTQETLHLGQVKKGDKVAETFTFKNISDHPIEIDMVSTCECTEAKWTVGTIQPGAEGKIDFIFDSSEKDKVEPVDVDVYFMDINPKTGNPYSTYLQYTYEFK